MSTVAAHEAPEGKRLNRREMRKTREERRMALKDIGAVGEGPLFKAAADFNDWEQEGEVSGNDFSSDSSAELDWNYNYTEKDEYLEITSELSFHDSSFGVPSSARSEGDTITSFETTIPDFEHDVEGEMDDHLSIEVDPEEHVEHVSVPFAYTKTARPRPGRKQKTKPRKSFSGLKKRVSFGFVQQQDTLASEPIPAEASDDSQFDIAVSTLDDDVSLESASTSISKDVSEALNSSKMHAEEQEQEHQPDSAPEPVSLAQKPKRKRPARRTKKSRDMLTTIPEVPMTDVDTAPGDDEAVSESHDLSYGINDAASFDFDNDNDNNFDNDMHSFDQVEDFSVDQDISEEQDDSDESSVESRSMTKKAHLKKAVPQKPKRRPVASYKQKQPIGKDGKKHRRQTLFLVDKAKTLGLVDDDDMYSEDSESVRRSSRKRVPPLKYWKNERLLYSRSGDGYGAVLPVYSGEILNSNDDEEYPKRKRPKRSTKKQSKESREMKRYTVDKRRHLKGDQQVLDLKTGSEIEVVTGLTEGMLNFDTIPGADGAPVKAAKFFDTDFFTNGVLYIPPRAEKPSERVGTPETFVVLACPGEKLEVTIEGCSRRYATGDSFWIPPGNTYSMRNCSKREEIKVAFFLTNQPSS